MDRRSFLHGSAALSGLSLLQGCAKHIAAPAMATAPALPFYDVPGNILPIRADVDRIFRITVCLRPFRAVGPHMDVVKVGDKTVVTNYGHGGSGWSLSWGSADVVVRKAMEAAPGVKECAVIGAGALGLTTALTAQRMGYKVTIYAKETAPYIRSVRATGSWTPDSRVALSTDAPADFAALWERMARTSWAMYNSYLGVAGSPIEWTDRISFRMIRRAIEIALSIRIRPLILPTKQNRCTSSRVTAKASRTLLPSPKTCLLVQRRSPRSMCVVIRR